MTVIERLKHFLDKNNMKVPTVADGTGIPATNIHKWLQGRANPKYEDTVKLEKFLNGEKVPEAAKAKDTSDTSISGISERYLTLLEETVKEKKEAARGLETRLNVIEQNQKVILSKLEMLVAGVPEPLTSKASKFEQEVVIAYKDNPSKAGKSSKSKPSRR